MSICRQQQETLQETVQETLTAVNPDLLRHHGTRNLRI